VKKRVHVTPHFECDFRFFIKKRVPKKSRFTTLVSLSKGGFESASVHFLELCITIDFWILKENFKKDSGRDSMRRPR